MTRARLFTMMALSAAGATACIAEVTFDPVGTAASVEAQWTITAEPPTEERCASLGIAYVRVRFFDGERTADHPDLVFPCADGAFDTRPEQVLAEGRWTMQLLAIDAEGNVIDAGEMEVFSTAEEAGHVALTPTDFELP